MDASTGSNGSTDKGDAQESKRRKRSHSSMAGLFRSASVVLPEPRPSGPATASSADEGFNPYAGYDRPDAGMYAYQSDGEGREMRSPAALQLGDDLDTDFLEDEGGGHYANFKSLDDWNTRFQECKERIEEFDSNTSIQDRISVNVTLIYLYRDFLYCVRTYSRIIISELYLPYSQKTIKPFDYGGVAGGVKYRVNNILFKFAINSRGMYGDDYAASKVAGHELKSLISYVNCEVKDLHFPLMALVDYRGYRILAMSVLPINKHSIRYGTDDAGATIYAANQQLLGLLESAATRLNLKPHRVSNQTRTISHTFYSAADVEGHEGSDGRLYLIDFSRTFPPHAPEKNSVKMSHLFQLLRPEYVISYEKPLCPDAFSRFVATEELRSHNAEVRDATKHLHERVIPQLAAELDGHLSELVSSKGELSHFRLIEMTHSSGVNIRFLGELRHHSKCPFVKYILLLEMLARLLKTTMRFQLRETMKKLKVPLEQPYLELLVELLNLVFGSSPKSQRYWQEKIKVRLHAKFVMAFSPEEAADSYDLKAALQAPVPFGGPAGIKLLFLKVKDMMGLSFAPVVFTQLDTNPQYLAADSPLDPVDLEELTECVKHTNVIAHSQGYLLKMKGLMKTKAKDVLSGQRFFQMAVDQCEESLNTNPNHKLTLRNCAQLLTFLGGALNPGSCGDWNSPTMKRANSYFQRAIRVDSTDAHSTFQYVLFPPLRLTPSQVRALSGVLQAASGGGELLPENARAGSALRPLSSRICAVSGVAGQARGGHQAERALRCHCRRPEDQPVPSRLQKRWPADVSANRAPVGVR
jgi:hypothetical protein